MKRGWLAADAPLAAVLLLLVPVITLGGDLASSDYRPSGEWTSEGHRAAAAAIARRLCPAMPHPG